jgi:RNA polymerase sigma factor (sigma-70 family)
MCAAAGSPETSQDPVLSCAGGDIEELYRRFSTRLERTVRLGVRAPEPVVEDACQVAWSRLIRHSERVRRETALSWLTTTALHEAFRLLRRSRRELSLEDAVEAGGEAVIHARALSASEVFEQRERLAGIGILPERQQRLLWLRALGLSYTEMAAYEECSPRTVERQLHRATQTIAPAGRGRSIASGEAPGLAP